MKAPVLLVYRLGGTPDPHLREVIAHILDETGIAGPERYVGRLRGPQRVWASDVVGSPCFACEGRGGKRTADATVSAEGVDLTDAWKVCVSCNGTGRRTTWRDLWVPTDYDGMASGPVYGMGEDAAVEACTTAYNGKHPALALPAWNGVTTGYRIACEREWLAMRLPGGSVDPLAERIAHRVVCAELGLFKDHTQPD